MAVQVCSWGEQQLKSIEDARGEGELPEHLQIRVGMDGVKPKAGGSHTWNGWVGLAAAWQSQRCPWHEMIFQVPSKPFLDDNQCRDGGGVCGHPEFWGSLGAEPAPSQQIHQPCSSFQC